MRSRSPHTYTRRLDRIRPLGSRSVPVSPRPRAPIKVPKSVLLTRSAAAGETLKSGLKARGRGLLVQHLLVTSPLDAPLPDLQNYQAVIASSVVAVEILAAQSQARTCQLYVVGKASAAAAAAAGYIAVTASATAVDLASLMRRELNPTAGPVLYVAGRHRARDMGQLLSSFDLDLVEVYAAAKIRILTPAVRRALKRGQISQIAFYSARAADAFMAAAARAGVAKEARRATALCLSPRIAARLQAHGWRRTWAARVPAADQIDARLLTNRAPLRPIADSANKTPLASSTPSPAISAAPEASMTSPAPTTPVASESAPPADGRTSPGWPAFIAVAVLAAIFAGVAWYLSNDRAGGLQAEVALLRDRVGTLNLDPGKADRAALAARTEEAAKVSTALAAVAAKAADKASVDSLSDRVDALGKKSEAALSDLAAQTAKDVAAAQSIAKEAADKGAAFVEAAEAQRVAQAKSIKELAQKIEELEQRFAKVEAWTKGASPAQLAEQLIALSDLKQLVNRGVPFAAALARASRALPDVANANSAWLKRAGTSIPTYAQLSAELAEIERKLPLPRSDASGNAVVDSALGLLLSGIKVEGQGALVDDPDRAAVAAAQKALGDGDPGAAAAAIADLAGRVCAVDGWKADLASRMEAEVAFTTWEKSVLATVGENVQ